MNGRSRDFAPNYLSPASEGMTIRITGPTNVLETAGLTVTTKGCHGSLITLQCALTVSALKACPSTKACYTADVTVYDKYNAVKNKIPHGARALSAISGLKFSIASGQTLVPLVLDGIPRRIAFLPAANSVLIGSQIGGFTLPKCNSSPQDVSVVGTDADGNYIVGPGAPKLSLVSNDASQLAVKHRKASQPNVYTLEAPKSPNYPFGGRTINLTAKATPAQQSLGHAVTTLIHVTYSGDICGIFSEFSTSGGRPVDIVAGPDGNMWFTEQTGNKIGRITTAGTDLVTFDVPTSASGPILLTVGPDRNLWFTEAAGNKIARITTAGAITEFSIPTLGSEPAGIVTGPDGNLWFAEASGNKIGKMTTAGTFTEYPTITAGSEPFGIAVGPDDNLWFTESGVNKIGYMDTTGSGFEYAIPTASSTPAGIVAGPDGGMWFAECTGNRIGRISAASDQFFNVPLPAAGSEPVFLVTGPDGAVWFTEQSESRIGRVGGLQTITEFSTPTTPSGPFGITVGPDGAMWFAEAAGNIGRLR